MKHLAILPLIVTLGACAAAPRPESGDRQADLSARYVSALERDARRGFKSIYWVTLPSNAQVAQRTGARDRQE